MTDERNIKLNDEIMARKSPAVSTGERESNRSSAETFSDDMMNVLAIPMTN